MRMELEVSHGGPLEAAVIEASYAAQTEARVLQPRIR